VDPVQGLAAEAAAKNQGHGLGSLDLDPRIAAELGLVHVFERIAEHLGPRPGPSISRVRLSSASTDEFRGNPVDLRGFPALSVAVWNANAFTLYLGVGAGRGTATDRLLVIPASKLVVLPLDDEVFSIGTAAANIDSAEAEVVVVRFAEVKDPGAYALA
jgi:hypothetical protein